jgi:hypothetical protein
MRSSRVRRESGESSQECARKWASEWANLSLRRELRSITIKPVGIAQSLEIEGGGDGVSGRGQEQEEQCDLNTLCGDAVGIAGTVALEQALSLEFSQIVAELVQTVSGV